MQRHGVGHRRQQDRFVHRLGEKISGTRLDRPHAHRDVTVAGEEHDGHALPGFLQTRLQFETVDARHAHVEDDAAPRRFGCRASR